MQFHFFCILMLGVSLVKTLDPEPCKCEEKVNTCTILPGSNGLPGTPGSPGLPGRDGKEGPRGEKGEPGLRGMQGPPGKAGPPGAKGDQGVKGQKGDCGDKELELLKTHIRDLKAEVKTLQETTKKTHQALIGYIFPNTTRAGTKIFVSNGSEGDFEASKKICYNFGGQMASPRNEEENNTVLKLAAQFGRHVFFGMNDQETEGVFKHLNGDPMEYSNWAEGEPNGEHEDCIELYMNSKWNDNSCNISRLIVCEF